MERNMSRIESWIRILFGSLFFIYLILGGPWWAVFGLYFMLSGSFRFCLFYFYLSDRKL